MRFTLITTLLLTSAIAHSAQESSPVEKTAPLSDLLTPYAAKYTATYDAGWFPISVSATRELKTLDNNKWQISFEAYSSIADFSERSQFALEKQIKPLDYQYKTSGFFSKKRRSKTFDWENKTVQINKKQKADYEVPNHLLDNISYQEQMRLDLSKGETQLSYNVAYKERIREYEFKVVGEHTFNSSIGKIETIKVAQTNHRNKKEKTHIWLAKDHQFLIVKLFIVDRHGDKNTIILKNAQVGDTSFELK